MDPWKDLFEAVEGLGNDERLALDAFGRVSGRLGLPSSRTGRRPGVWKVLTGIAAALFIPSLAAALYFAFSPAGADPAWNEVRVPPASSRTLTLSDGTVLTLKAGSHLVYPGTFSGPERKVFLDGEVFADVSHDPDHPFIISSGNVSLKVYGTKFDFRSFSSDVHSEVALVDGKVSLGVGDGRREITLSPGDIVQYDRNSGKVEMGSYSVELVTSMTGKDMLAFVNLPMEDIARSLERHFGVSILVADRRLASERFLAYFANGESLEEILSALGNIYPMSSTEKDGIIYLSSKQNK